LRIPQDLLDSSACRRRVVETDKKLSAEVETRKRDNLRLKLFRQFLYLVLRPLVLNDIVEDNVQTGPAALQVVEKRLGIAAMPAAFAHESVKLQELIDFRPRNLVGAEAHFDNVAGVEQGHERVLDPEAATQCPEPFQGGRVGRNVVDDGPNAFSAGLKSTKVLDSSPA
jgi:hypothetical protein